MKWIKVSNKLPPQNGDHFIGYGPEVGIDIYQTYYDNKYIAISDCDEVYPIQKELVTHWMELPERPDEVD